MKIRHMFAAAAIAVAAFAGSANAANLIQNGSFEEGTDPGSFTSLTPGSTDITDWSIGPIGVDYIGSYWQAADGSRSVDLAGTLPGGTATGDASGSIFQSFATTLGQTYQVT